MINKVNQSINIILGKITIVIINLYQRYISPRKGFSCAHRILYGDQSCSPYVKVTVSRFGFFKAIPLSIKRFQRCKTASDILQDINKYTSYACEFHFCSNNCSQLECCCNGDNCVPSCSLPSCSLPSCPLNLFSSFNSALLRSPSVSQASNKISLPRV